MRSSQVAVAARESASSSSGVSASRCSRRLAIVAKRGSAATPGASTMSISSSQNFWVMHIRKIQPSAVRYNCTGTALGWAPRGRRPVTSPWFRYQVPG